MKIVLTGASGFIGLHMLPILISEGHEVIAVTRDKSCLSQFQDQCQIIEHDIGKEDEIFCSSMGQADALLHLAWGGLPNYRSLHHYEVELPSHYRFVKGMIENGIKHISIVGTCFEYGMQSGPLSEDVETRPDNPYGFAKDTLRKQLELLRNETEFDLTWMRLFYLYGDGQSSNSLYSQLSSAVRNEDQVFNMSGGEQLRDYLHVNDVVSGIVKLVNRKENIGLVNICSGEPVSIRRLVGQWKELNNWSIELNMGFYPYPDYEPHAFWGDNTKYKSLISSLSKK